MAPMKLFLLLLVLFCIHRANGRQSTTTVRTSKPDDRSEDVIYHRDGFQKTGCFNLECPGFQWEADAHISPGDVITPVSQINGAKQSITIKAAKNNDTGDWWVYYGSNGPETAGGHFPKSLFTDLANSTWDFTFGGYATKEGSAPTPPMGSGSNQQGQAASFSGVQYVLQDGTVSPVTGNLTSHTDRSDCYSVTPFVDGMFFYGVPLAAVSDRCELKE